MRFRPVHLLLLAGLVYWTSGAGLYYHELIEHGDHDEIAEGANTDHDAQSHAGEKDRHHHHDHDDCPTCQLLATMHADRVAPPVVVSALVPCFVILQVTDRVPPTVDTSSFIPIRGPPAVAA